MGALVDLLAAPVSPDTMPDGSDALETLTVVSVAGETTGGSSIYVNPVLGAGNKYFYKTGAAPLEYPAYGETVSQTAWDGSAEITGLSAGNQLMVIETDSAGRALKAGTAIITVKSE